MPLISTMALLRILRGLALARGTRHAARNTLLLSSLCCLCMRMPAEAAGRLVRAITVDDKAVEGALLGLDATPALELQVGAEKRRIPCADLLAIELRQARPAPSPDAAAVVLRNGDVLRGAIQGGSSRAVTLRGPAFGLAECPIQAIARIELPTPQPAQPAQAPERLDKLLLRNNEAIEGTLESLDATGIKFRSALLGDIEIGFDRMTAIAFAAQAGVPPKTPPGVAAIIHAADGSTVTGQLRGIQDASLRLQAAFGPALTLPLVQLLSIEFRGGRLVYLSDLEPAEAKETPYFDLVWHYRRDRSVDGNPLRIGGRTYRKGLGVHSRSELTYALEGAYTRFLADLGIDDEVGDKGNADVQILLDGKLAFERKAVRGGQQSIPVSLDVTGAARLTLLVDFGADFDICDHLNWANARLIR